MTCIGHLTSFSSLTKELAAILSYIKSIPQDAVLVPTTVRKDVDFIRRLFCITEGDCAVARGKRLNNIDYYVFVERSGSGVELRTLDYENPGSRVPWASFFTLHCSSSLSCLNEYLTIDSGGYVYEQSSRINCSIWLDASQRSRDGI